MSNAQKAHQSVKYAIKRGELTRLDTCELCDKDRQVEKISIDFMGNSKIYQCNELMIAHHYAGYDGENAIDIWWVCRSCNRKLQGYHDGSLTKEQARAIILSKKI